MPSRPLGQSTWLVERAISHDPQIRAMAARDPSTPVGYLRRLALDPDVRVASQVRLNPSRPHPLVVRQVRDCDLRGLTAAEAADAVRDMYVDARCLCSAPALVLNTTGFACEQCQVIIDSAANELSSHMMLVWRGASGTWHPSPPGMTGADVVQRRALPEPTPEVPFVVQAAS